ncbi:hypothetical protein V6N13_060173 [Hibiscus sabdariffa]|uniref:Protein kinase domain-containing protein n=1 Tax=Hibiscus sabdariffa TaxID=183260 RepID=A0ABR2GAV2_9ROSI
MCRQRLESKLQLKKITQTQSSIKGVREFVAKIESLGRLRYNQRLYEHDTDWHTTNVVGTIGYIAPELARNGKASTSSEVFAYGVIECHQMGRILDALDPKLNSGHVMEEVKLVLLLGLVCSHPNPEIRPSMRRIVRYLSGDKHLPSIDIWESFDSKEGMYSMFLETISSHTITKPYPSSSIDHILNNTLIYF